MQNTTSAMRSGKLKSGDKDEGPSKWLVGNSALCHDFVVTDDKYSSLLSATSLVLIGAYFFCAFMVSCCSIMLEDVLHVSCLHTGQPQQAQAHVVLSIGHDAHLPEPLAGACVLGKPARELFTDDASAALESSWHDNDSFCSSMCAGGPAGFKTLLCSVPVPSPGSASVRCLCGHMCSLKHAVLESACDGCNLYQ